MWVSFKGEADGQPCHVFGLEFPVGEWVDVDGRVALKLSANPMFEVDTDGDGEAGPTLEEVRAELDARRIKYHPKAGVKKLLALLPEAAA